MQKNILLWMIFLKSVKIVHQKIRIGNRKLSFKEFFSYIFILNAVFAWKFKNHFHVDVLSSSILVHNFSCTVVNKTRFVEHIYLFDSSLLCLTIGKIKMTMTKGQKS